MNNLNSLLPKTQEVLVMLSEVKLMESFTFVGGSALAVYLNHRLSEDLDFFSSEAELDTKAILDAINRLKPTDFRIINNSKTQLDLFINNVKVTFFANNWNELNNKTKLINHISIAPIHLLCAMKINTLFLRAKYRDYYDLYVINKDVYALKEMFDFGKKLIPGLTLKLFQNALVFVKDVDDESIKHLKPKYKLSLNKIATHFEQTIRLWLNSGK